jgi:hypothetical protein
MWILKSASPRSTAGTVRGACHGTGAAAALRGSPCFGRLLGYHPRRATPPRSPCPLLSSPPWRGGLGSLPSTVTGSSPTFPSPASPRRRKTAWNAWDGPAPSGQPHPEQADSAFLRVASLRNPLPARRRPPGATQSRAQTEHFLPGRQKRPRSSLPAGRNGTGSVPLPRMTDPEAGAPPWPGPFCHPAPQRVDCGPGKDWRAVRRTETGPDHAAQGASTPTGTEKSPWGNGRRRGRPTGQKSASDARPCSPPRGGPCLAEAWGRAAPIALQSAARTPCQSLPPLLLVLLEGGSAGRDGHSALLWAWDPLALSPNTLKEKLRIPQAP